MEKEPFGVPFFVPCRHLVTKRAMAGSCHRVAEPCHTMARPCHILKRGVAARDPLAFHVYRASSRYRTNRASSRLELAKRKGKLPDKTNATMRAASSTRGPDWLWVGGPGWGRVPRAGVHTDSFSSSKYLVRKSWKVVSSTLKRSYPVPLNPSFSSERIIPSG